jgi:hypothetical protein
MAQRKETKKKVRVRDMKPKKDAKGGRLPPGGSPNKQTGGGQQMDRIFGP